MRVSKRRGIAGLFPFFAFASLSLLVAVVAIYGWDYYLLDQAERPFSAKHSLLKPGGTIGLRLGMLGFLMFVVVFVYSLRKHWAWLGKKGNTRNWLQYHAVAGIFGPVLITLHSSFKFHGLAGIAYWVMVALVISGIIGRYLYAQIPRTLEAAELSFKELDEAKAELQRELDTSDAVAAIDTLRLFHLPGPDEVGRMSLAGAALHMVFLDLLWPVYSWRLRHLLSERSGSSRELRRVVSIALEQASLSKRILFLSRAQSMFHLWHVVHRPFSYTFTILVLIHVSVALLFGYY